MALFNEIQVGRFNAVLHKLLDMEEGAPAPQLSGDVVPTICLESDRPEYRWLGGERLCHGGISVAAGGATTLSKVGLFNPAGSGVLCVVSRWHFSAEAATRFGIYTTPRANSLTNKADAMIMDGRWNRGFTAGGPFPSVQIDWETVAGYVGAAIDNLRVLAHTDIREPCAWVLPPDSGVHLVNTVADSSMVGGFQWTERALELGER